MHSRTLRQNKCIQTEITTFLKNPKYHPQYRRISVSFTRFLKSHTIAITKRNNGNSERLWETARKCLDSIGVVEALPDSWNTSSKCIRENVLKTFFLITSYTHSQNHKSVSDKRLCKALIQSETMWRFRVPDNSPLNIPREEKYRFCCRWMLP